MADKRMFSKTIIDSDAFLEMQQSAQLLYFHLSMRADDDGFINKPKTIMRMVGCKDDDLRILVSRKFIIPFDTGVVVIKHWKIHNYIAKDRYHETNYKEEMAMLSLDENKAYTLNDSSLYTDCIQVVDKMETQVRLGKDRLGKDSNSSRFTPPTPEEIKAYCIERQNSVDYERFYDFYSSKGWMVGKNKMKDWKAAVRTWEKGNKQTSSSTPKTTNRFNNFDQRDYTKQDYEDLESKLMNMDYFKED